ncbi:MAG: MFS transporter [Chloroflexi bacterium]|nr:MAG: MFS transporter [Chloroflexota bacterium]
MINDYGLLLAGRVLRAFGFGFSAVLLGLHLERRGLPPAQIGLAVTVALLTAALSGLLAAGLSRRLGRRAVLAGIGVLMGATGFVLGLSADHLVLILAGATGMLGAAGLDVGPFLAVEQPMLAESVPARGRNLAFARYSLSGALAGAAGGLAATFATDLSRSALLYLLYGGLGLATAALPLLLSGRVEAVPAPPTRFELRPLAGLAALFGVDALGGGFIANAVIAYWLHARFGAGAQVLGPAFAGIGLVQAAAYELSGRLGNRIGLVNTMVFTHLPSNLFLLAVPLSPNLTWALVLLFLRFSTSQMDVPARQAYVVSIVPPAHRASAVATTSAVRGLGLAVGPYLSGLSIQAALFGIPFFAGGALKIAYDLGLYAGFRSRRAQHET